MTSVMNLLIDADILLIVERGIQSAILAAIINIRLFKPPKAE